MRNICISLVAAVALLAPVAALADTGAPTPATAAGQICKQEQATLKAAFNTTYGTNASKANAFGKCVAKNAKNAQQALDNASKSCKAEQAADPAAFAQKYGTNGKSGSNGAGKNALGKCISAKVQQTASADAAKAPSAMKQCKAAAKADPAGFAGTYGAGRDALGKCVAAKAHTK